MLFAFNSLIPNNVLAHKFCSVLFWGSICLVWFFLFFYFNFSVSLCVSVSCKQNKHRIFKYSFDCYCIHLCLLELLIYRIYFYHPIFMLFPYFSLPLIFPFPSSSKLIIFIIPLFDFQSICKLYDLLLFF